MKKLLYAFIGTAALLLSSCINDLTQQSMQDIIPENTLRLTLNVPKLIAEAGETRATVEPETGEDQLSSLYILFFEPSSTRAGLFVDYVKLNGPLAMNTPIDVNLMGTEVNVTDAYHILAIANIDDIAGNRYLNETSEDSWMLQWVNKTEREVMIEAFAWTRSGFLISPGKLLMNGRVEKADHEFHLYLSLTRNQVRYDVINDVREDYDLMSVEIRNAYPTSSIWNMGAVDYTTNTGRIAVYYEYDNKSNTIGNGSDGNGPMLDDIKGNLYTFENQVPAPVQNDRYTTCLIIGLQPRGGGVTTYYRANIHPDESAQALKRNNAYLLTIRNVGGPGAASKEDAYNHPGSNELDFTINYWDIGTEGIIVQDGSSLLSSPVKTVRIGTDGGVFSYQILTFTSSPNPVSPLSIRRQTLPTDITATLNGNTLIINAQPLGLESERSGTIQLGYAGLEAVIEVIQTELMDDFLVVHLPDGGIPRFAPIGGIGSGLLRVEASDYWTAEIFTEGTGGFSFEDGASVIIISSDPTSDNYDATLIEDNKFRIYTFGANSSPTPREAFIVVTLDKDPENYAQVVRVSQAAAGGISIMPSQTQVTFNGMGTGLAAVPNNTVDKFQVLPSQHIVDDGPPMIIDIMVWDWTWLSGDDSRFTVTEGPHSTSDPADNWIQVGAVGMNTSGRTYSAVLRLYLHDLGPANNQPHVDITIMQQSEGLDFAPNIVPAVPVVGGQSQLVKIDADASLSYTATIQTISGTSGGRVLVQHKAKLIDGSGNEINPSDIKSVGTDGFKVEFPKVYYPNREISIAAEVTVTVEGMTKTMRFTQTPLTPKPMIGYGMTGTPAYGGMGNTYNRGWDGTSGSFGLAQIPGYSQSGTGNMSATIAANVTYLHATPHISGSSGTNYTWAAINNYIDTRDAWTVLQTQDNNGVGPMNNINSPTKRNGAGYGNVTYTGSANPTVYQGYGSNPENQPKVYRFVMDKGHTPLTPAQVASFYSDAVSCVMPSWPASAVVLTARNSDTHAMLIVDIKNKFMWIGESQQFWYDTYLTNNRGVFLDNLMYFVGNASKYGSHFTDLLLEDDQPGAQPAPWDDVYWGANAGVPSK